MLVISLYLLWEHLEYQHLVNKWMDGWQGEKKEDKRDLVSGPGSSGPIHGQRTRSRISGEERDEEWPEGRWN